MEVLIWRKNDPGRDQCRFCEMCVKLLNIDELRAQRTRIRQDQFAVFSEDCEDCEDDCGGYLGMFLCSSCFDCYEGASSEHSHLR